MSIPFVAEVRIPGKYRDAWLYKNRVYTWDRSGALRYADLELISRYVAKTYGSGVANIIQTLVFRNDWKVGEQFKAMMRVPEMEAAFILPFRDQRPLAVEIPDQFFSENQAERYDGIVLDTNIYADRVYLATTDGLFESYINSNDPARGYALDEHLSFRVSKVAVKYSAINASAEGKGLHFARVRFADESGPGFKRVNWRQIADTSFSTSHAHQNLLNYTGQSVPVLLKAKIEESKPHENARFKESQVLGYEDEQLDLTSLTYSAASSAAKVSAASGGHAPSEQEGFEVLGNSNNHLLVVWNGKTRVIDISARQGKDVEAKPNIGYQSSSIGLHSDDVLQTYPINGGFVVELENALLLITQSGTFELSNGQFARVRTFAGSIRHKETVAVIHEDHVALFGYYTTPETLF